VAETQKSLPGDADVDAFVAAVADDARRADAEALRGLLSGWTGEPPVMWGASIVGFGRYRYRYESGREGTAPLVGFSPRKANLVVYLVAGVQDLYPDVLERLGPHKLGKGCLYLKRLVDVDRDALRALVEGTMRVHRAADERARAGD